MKQQGNSYQKANFTTKDSNNSEEEEKYQILNSKN
jgi:hypothetical protein